MVRLGMQIATSLISGTGVYAAKLNLSGLVTQKWDGSESNHIFLNISIQMCYAESDDVG